jgi:hypothetical protein
MQEAASGVHNAAVAPPLRLMVVAPTKRTMHATACLWAFSAAVAIPAFTLATCVLAAGIPISRPCAANDVGFEEDKARKAPLDVGNGFKDSVCLPTPAQITTQLKKSNRLSQPSSKTSLQPDLTKCSEASCSPEMHHLH